MNIERYDAVVLGCGEAGKYIAWHLASHGRRVAVIERRYIGGSCPNIACLPSKNIIYSAKIASDFANSELFGLLKHDWKVSMPAVRARKRAMVDGLYEMHMGNFVKSGAEIVMGSGRFIGERTIEVSHVDGSIRQLAGEHVFLDVGTRASLPAIAGLEEAAPLTHVEALELDVVPEHLIVLGAGYVGLEFAQALRRFGSRVTVIERGDRLLHHEDEDISQGLQDLFRDEGIEILYDTEVTQVSGRSGSSVVLQTLQNSQPGSIEGSHLLVATGRTPNSDGINAESAGIAIKPNGYIQVNERLETTAPNVWAMGDCADSPHFTHIAYDDFRVVRANLEGQNRTTKDRQVPFCLYTDPEFARIGLNETEAVKRNIPYRVSKIKMEAVLRTRTLSQTRGFLKALVGKEDDRILGFMGFGVEVGELLPTIQLAMRADLPYTAIRDLVVTHPTISEGLVTLFSSIKPY